MCEAVLLIAIAYTAHCYYRYSELLQLQLLLLLLLLLLPQLLLL
jgi:hypothetical protein